jgi:hypothetical protein
MATLPGSGAISIGTLNGFFSGSGTAMSNFYRGGGRVPSTRTVAITVREPSSGEFYSFRWEWVRNYASGNESDIWWNGSYIGSADISATSFTSGSVTYFRGSFQTSDFDPELGTLRDYYGIFRTFPSTTTVAINTGVPSSGTISLSNFYGAVNS